MTQITEKLLAAMVAKAVAQALPVVLAQVTGQAKQEAKIAVKSTDTELEAAQKKSLAKFNSPDPAKQDKSIKRLSKTVREFNRRGIKIGMGDLYTEVRPVNGPNGWRVRGFMPLKGSKSVRGLFHQSQVGAIKAPSKAEQQAEISKLSAEYRAKKQSASVAAQAYHMV